MTGRSSGPSLLSPVPPCMFTSTILLVQLQALVLSRRTVRSDTCLEFAASTSPRLLDNGWSVGHLAPGSREAVSGNGTLCSCEGARAARCTILVFHAASTALSYELMQEHAHSHYRLYSRISFMFRTKSRHWWPPVQPSGVLLFHAIALLPFHFDVL